MSTGVGLKHAAVGAEGGRVYGSVYRLLHCDWAGVRADQGFFGGFIYVLFFKMSSRLSALKQHLASTVTPQGPGHKHPDDVVVVWAKRTAIGRARKGAFAKTTPDTLLAAVLKASIDETGLPYDAIGDVCVGNVQLGGSYAGPARMAQFVAGFPETVRVPHMPVPRRPPLPQPLGRFRVRRLRRVHVASWCSRCIRDQYTAEGGSIGQTGHWGGQMRAHGEGGGW